MSRFVVTLTFDETWDEESIKQTFDDMPGITSISIQQKHCGKCAEGMEQC